MATPSKEDSTAALLRRVRRPLANARPAVLAGQAFDVVTGLLLIASFVWLAYRSWMPEGGRADPGGLIVLAIPVADLLGHLFTFVKAERVAEIEVRNRTAG
jgi:hypothetical protein